MPGVVPVFAGVVGVPLFEPFGELLAHLPKPFGLLLVLGQVAPRPRWPQEPSELPGDHLRGDSIPDVVDVEHLNTPRWILLGDLPHLPGAGQEPDEGVDDRLGAVETADRVLERIELDQGQLKPPILLFEGVANTPSQVVLEVGIQAAETEVERLDFGPSLGQLPVELPG